MNSGLHKSFGILVFLLFPLMSFAQMPKALSRVQIGVSYPTSAATFHSRYMITDTLGDNNLDTSFSKRFKPNSGFGVSVGTYFPLVSMGKGSSLNLSVDFVYYSTEWDASILVPTGINPLNDKYLFRAEKIEASTVQMAVPIGIDYKTGPESTCDKSKTVSLTLGTGVYVSRNTTSFGGVDFDKNKVQPYIKAEVGAFGGINWKLRALFAFGKLNYMQTDSPSASMRLEDRSSLMLSFVIQPFSFTWNKASWWN